MTTTTIKNYYNKDNYIQITFIIIITYCILYYYLLIPKYYMKKPSKLDSDFRAYALTDRSSNLHNWS